MPHCRLHVVKALIHAGKIRTTLAARRGGLAIGFDTPEMIALVLALEEKYFYKSMTTQSDHRVWQDVYHAPSSAGIVYLKLTVVEDVLIVSFKER